MGSYYPEEMVLDFIDEYEDEWGVTLPSEDALLMMALFDGLSALMEKYDGDLGDAGWSMGLPSLHRR